MNKKLLITLFLIVLIIIISSVVFATFTDSSITNENMISTNEYVLDINDTYIEENSTKINQDNYIKLAKDYLNTYNFINKDIETSKLKINVYEDKVNSLTEVVITNSDMIVKLNKQNGELISYINQKNVYEKNTHSGTEIEQIALDIFSNIDNIDKYQMISLTQFDDEIYQAKFCKKYGEYTNPGELISFSFAPETTEVVTFAKKSIPFANNSIQVNENASRTIAEKYLAKSSANDMTVSIEIVTPNYNLESTLEYNQVYKNAKETRLAYVYRFNNSAQTEIYIDCTTGKVIGSNLIIGGEF